MQLFLFTAFTSGNTRKTKVLQENAGEIYIMQKSNNLYSDNWIKRQKMSALLVNMHSQTAVMYCTVHIEDSHENITDRLDIFTSAKCKPLI